MEAVHAVHLVMVISPFLRHEGFYTGLEQSIKVLIRGSL